MSEVAAQEEPDPARRRGMPPRGPAVLVALVACASLVAAGLAWSASTEEGKAGVPERRTPSTSSTTTLLPAAVLPDPAFIAALDSIRVESGDACIQVTTGSEILYEAAADRPLMPASVTKLATGAAALELLGPDARLRTAVRSTALAVEGVLPGDLWLMGGGDPVLMTEAWAAALPVETRLYTSMDGLADQVVAAGVRHVAGAIIGDESRYDSIREVPSWPARFVSDGEVGPLTALTVNDGFRSQGHPGVRFDDPPTDAADLFTDLLRARGVLVGEAARSGAPPTDAIDVAWIESPPLGDIVDAMLRDSDNGSAELLVKELGVIQGGSGSTLAGAAVVQEVLVRAGIDMRGVVVADGSGLSEAARLTCRAVTDLLNAESRLLHDRLSVAGQDGTLGRRYVGSPAAGRIRAKTGSMRGVLGLAGYALTEDGSKLEFTYLINGAATRSAYDLQDRLLTTLVAAHPRAWRASSGRR